MQDPLHLPHFHNSVKTSRPGRRHFPVLTCPAGLGVVDKAAASWCDVVSLRCKSERGKGGDPGSPPQSLA